MPSNIEPVAPAVAANIEPVAPAVAANIEPAASAVVANIEPIVSAVAANIEPIASAVAANIAPIASAVAAGFSAMAAFTIMLIQRQSMIDSARPEIVLKDWTRETKNIGEKKYDIVSFKKVLNAGKGPALHALINITGLHQEPYLVTMSTIQIPIIPADEESAVDSQIILWWENKGANHYIALELKIYCWSTKKIRYVTTYTLSVNNLNSSNIYTPDGDAMKGIRLGSRRVASTPVWRLKVYSQLARIPLLGRLFHDDHN